MEKQHFLAGGLALSTSFAIMHPLDTLKTQIQTNSISRHHLFRGFGVSYLLAFPQGGLRLSTYEFIKKNLISLDCSVGLASALGACSGDFVSSIVKVPREVITTRVQSRVSDSARHVFKEVGFSGLFRGFWSTTARDWPFMIILFSTYESLKAHRGINNHAQGEISTLKSTLYGGFSGGLAGFLTTPFDVVKTEVMTCSNGMKATIDKLRNSGVRAFFRGGAARSIWW